MHIPSERVFIVSPIWLASNKTTRTNSQAYQNTNEGIIKDQTIKGNDINILLNIKYRKHSWMSKIK